MTHTERLSPTGTSQPSSIAGERGRFVINVASNIGFLLTRLVVAIWMTPYLIGHLGIGVFGIIALAESMIAYIEILTFSFNAAVSRFLTVELNRGDTRAANTTFNTALFGMLGGIAIFMPVVWLFSLVFPRVFNVPAGFERDASWFFVIAVLAFCVGMVTSNFAVSTFAHSRFLVRNLVNLAALFARVGLIVLLFTFLPASLWHVALGMLLASLISMGGYVILWRRLTPDLGVRFRLFDRSKLRPLLRMGGWVLVNRVGVMLLRNVDLMIVNLTLGAAATGLLGIGEQVTRNIRNLVGAFGDVINPVILRKYAQGDARGLKQISLQGTKLMGLGLALPIGLISGFSRPFLSIWLGPSFEYLSPLLIAMVSYMSVIFCVRPLLHIQEAHNKIRWPGIFTVVAGVINVVLDFVAVWVGWGLVGIAVASLVAWSVKNVIFMPVYAAHIMKLRWHTFFPSLIVTALTTLGVGLAAYGLTKVYVPTGWISLGVAAAIVSLAYAIVVGLVVLDRADWRLLKSLVFKRT